MHAAFRYVFAGLLLVFLDFRIGGFDLLPDFVGWALVAYGALQLTSFGKGFFVAGCLAAPLAVFDVIFLLAGNSIPLLGYFVAVVHCACIWTLLGGIADVAIVSQRHELALSATKLRVVYVAIISASVLLGSLFQSTNDSLAMLIGGALAIAALITVVFILRLVYRAGSKLPF